MSVYLVESVDLVSVELVVKYTYLTSKTRFYIVPATGEPKEFLKKIKSFQKLMAKKSYHTCVINLNDDKATSVDESSAKILSLYNFGYCKNLKYCAQKIS